MELSGATTANWVAKSANLLVDGLGAPARVGLLLPLHWQAVSLLLAGVATGAEVHVGDVDDCDAAFVSADRVEQVASSSTGPDDLLALSGHPLGAPCGPLPPLVQDYAREVPSYGDHFPGPRPPAARLLPAAPAVAGLGPGDRLLTVLPPDLPEGLGALLAALRAGASLVLAVGDLDLARLAAAERVTACAGADLQDLPRIV